MAQHDHGSARQLLGAMTPMSPDAGAGTLAGPGAAGRWNEEAAPAAAVSSRSSSPVRANGGAGSASGSPSTPVMKSQGSFKSSPTKEPKVLTMGQKVQLASTVRKLVAQQNLQPRIFGCLTLENPIRELAIRVAHHEAFETISLLVILANCVMLAIYDPLDSDNAGPRNQAIDHSEGAFQALFTIEAIIKLLAFGVYGRGQDASASKVGYFADPWNWLDFFIVVAGFLTMLPGLGEVRALRTFRVLRPLKSLSAVPSMRVVVSSMLTALPALGNVVLLAGFTLIVFGIIGVQLWAGMLLGRCSYEDPTSPGSFVPLDDVICGLPCDRQVGAECTPSAGDPCTPAWVRFTLADATMAQQYTGDPNNAGNETVQFLPTTCMPAENPYYGLVNFDDTGHAMLTLFTGITLEGWTDSMYFTQHAWGTKWLVAIYWVIMIAFGAFFLLQLALAVIWESYQGSTAGEEDKADELLAKHSSLLVAHLRAKAIPWHIRLRRSLGLPHPSVAAEVLPPSPPCPVGMQGEELAQHKAKAKQAGLLTEIVDMLPKPKPKPVYEPIWPALSAITSHPTFGNVLTGVIVLNTIQLAMPYYGMTDEYQHGLNIANYIFSAIFGVEMILKLAGDGIRRYLSDTFNCFDGAVVILSFIDIALTATMGDAAGGLAALRTFRLARVFKLARQFKDLARLLKTIVKSLVNVSSAVGVLALVLFIFTLLQMQLFGGGYQAAVDDGRLDELPRVNWDNFWIAFVSTFTIVTGENWNSYLSEANSVFGVTAVLVLISLVLIGNFIFLNLFLAILLGAFESEMDSEIEEKEHEAQAAMKAAEEAAAQQAAELAGDGGGQMSELILAGPPRVDTGTRVPGALKVRHLDSDATNSVVYVDNTGATPLSPSTGLTPLFTNRDDAGLGSGPAGANAGKNWQTDSKASSLTTTSKASVASSATAQPDSTANGGRPAAGSTAGLISPTSSTGLISPTNASPEKHRRRSSLSGIDRDTSALVTGPVSADMEMVVKGGDTKSFLTKIRNEAGKEVAVRVMASGDVQLVHGEDIKGNALDSAVAYKKLGVTAAPPHEGQYAAKQMSLFFLSPANALRKAAAILVAHPVFENVILLLILISSINLALDEPRIEHCAKLPLDNDENCVALAHWLSYSDIVITALFVLEMVAKIVALGFIRTETAYLRNPWNMLDFVIVIISVLSLALADLASKLKALRSLRALRALRPLRVVSRYPGLKLVVNAVIGAIPKVRNVLLINFLFLLLLAIVGLQNFSGAMAYCNDASVSGKADCVGEWTLLDDDCNQLPSQTMVDQCKASVEGVSFPRVWQSVPQNFDDIFKSVCTTFEVATGEAWPDIAVNAIDAVGTDEGMARDANPAAWLYFIVIQVACGFFLLELFTGVIIANYYQLKEESQGSGLLTEEQQKWVEQMKLMLSVNATRSMKRPETQMPWLRRLRNRAYNLALSKPFEWFIMLLIVANTIVLALRHYGENEEWVTSQEVANNVFAVMFACEAVTKLLAFGPKQYFAVAWNRFDFALVVASGIGVAASVGPVATLFRIFRVARIIRLVRVSRGLLLLFRTLIVSIPSLMNVGIILLLMLFIFSIVGMNLFAGIRYGEPGGGGLSRDANFDYFWTSMITLFRSSTGENFNGIMHDLEVQPPFCLSEEGPNGEPPNCGDKVSPAIFFSLFFTLTGFILIKLLVAVVLDSFSDMLAAEEESEIFRLTPDWLEKYTTAWGQCDPGATKFLHSNGLIKLISILPHPLGVEGGPDVEQTAGSHRKAAIKILGALDLPPSADGRYQFHSVLQELVKRASSGRMVPQAKVQMAGDMQLAQFSLRETLAAMRIQGLVRQVQARKFINVVKAARAKALAEQAAAAAGGAPMPPPMARHTSMGEMVVSAIMSGGRAVAGGCH